MNMHTYIDTYIHRYHLLLTLFITINITTNTYTMDILQYPTLIKLPTKDWQQDQNFVSSSYEALERNFNLYESLLPNQKWPTQTGTLNGFKAIWLDRNQDKKEDDFKLKMVEYCLSTRLTCTPDVLKKTDAFLVDKKATGSDREKALYKDMTVAEFVARQFIQRLPVCYNVNDTCLLLGNGSAKRNCSNKLKKVGTSMQNKDFPLSDTLSPDERHKVAPYLLLSCTTGCINKGDRDNQGKLEQNTQTIEQEIVYIAGIGARYEDPEAMDCLDLITQSEYQDGDIEIQLRDLSNNIKASGNTKIVVGKYFRPSTYKNRMIPVIQAIFDEAKRQAQLTGKKVYLQMVGLGLGAWELFDTKGKHGTVQTKIFLETCKDCLDSGNYAEHIADIDFSWFHDEAPQLVTELQDNTDFKDVMIHFSKRNPADKLTGENAGKLPVAVFAWDSMSGIGNEFNIGMLSASGDPAAACATLIALLMNPYINPFMIPNIIKTASEGNTSNPLEPSADVNATFDRCTQDIQRMITVATARKQATQQKETEKKQLEMALSQKLEGEKLEAQQIMQPLSDTIQAIKALANNFTSDSAPADIEQINLAIENAKKEAARIKNSLAPEATASLEILKPLSRDLGMLAESTQRTFDAMQLAIQHDKNRIELAKNKIDKLVKHKDLFSVDQQSTITTISIQVNELFDAIDKHYADPYNRSTREFSKSLEALEVQINGLRKNLLPIITQAKNAPTQTKKAELNAPEQGEKGNALLQPTTANTLELRPTQPEQSTAGYLQPADDNQTPARTADTWQTTNPTTEDETRAAEQTKEETVVLETPADNNSWSQYISSKTVALGIIPFTAVTAAILHYLEVLPTYITDFFSSLWQQLPSWPARNE